ncbi:MAG: cellulase family glycosylhydrolase [Chloroflexi bacterium]|nr:cellulase family glycosylhydrolase [Chloroflexota bacterium]
MTLRRIVIVGVILAALTVGLLLDLRAHGLVWQVFWSQTGEEEPLAQVRGMVEWVGNLIRAQPRNDPLVPVQHAGENPFGMNTFLQLEPDPAKVEQQLAQISAAGFAWIRQEFTWEDIEIHGRGDFADRRNVDAIGVVDAWAKYDRIVDLAEQYGLQIQARISNPPQWAQSSPEAGDMAPPVLIEDYVNFARTLAERYRGRIRFYQVWNEPNIYPEWGESDVDPEAYTDLLCAAHEALKAVDPEIVVISGALAPTIELSGRNLNDFVFFERMYAAGAGACFDVLSMQGYGLNSGPTDRRMRPVTVNVGRSQYIRELMIAHGDAYKPIWLSEAAWNAVPGEEADPRPIDARYNFGQVTLEQQARYMPLFYERIQSEWPWVGVVNYWFFTLPDDRRSNESFYYFRMAEPDYSAEKPSYSTLPVYDAMREYITAVDHPLRIGVHQAGEHWLIETDGGVIDADGTQFGTATSGGHTTFVAEGTGVALRWRGESLTVTVDGTTTTYTGNGSTWIETPVASDLFGGRFDVVVEGGAALLDAVIVRDDRNVAVGAIITVVLAIACAIGVLAVTLRRKTQSVPNNLTI